VNSSVSLASAILGGIVGYFVGYAFRAVWQAFVDLKGQKAKIPGLRKSAWTLAWTMTKVGAAATLVGAIMIFWFVRDQTDDGPTPLVPTKSAGPSPRR
jgi:membrane protein YqaA with SNARE-associated domain